MEIERLQQRAVQVRARLSEFEASTYGATWTIQDLLVGLATDLGDLGRAIQRIEGRRPLANTNARSDLEHELSDCLWVLLIIANKYNVNLSHAFESTMDGIERWLDQSAFEDDTKQ